MPEPRITKEQAARWQVIVPWQRGEVTTEVVAAEITVAGAEVTIKLIGSERRITFPHARAKLLLTALTEAVAAAEPKA